jgi:hypothetical protein
MLQLALALFLAARASAHGPPPAASALLAVEGEEATLVGLSRGLAHRTEDGFRFVCPETWGGDATAPAAGIPDGPALVASEKLFIVEPDGRVSLHPKQVGEGVALASNGEALFGLFLHEGQHELWRITESTSDLVRKLEEPFAALAAADSELSLLSWAGSALVLQTLSVSGELGERVTWSAPSAVAHAELRLTSDQRNVAIWGSAAPWVTLGHVTAQGYEQLAEGRSDIFGPVALAGGVFVARDGAFEALPEGAAQAGRSDYLTCLGSYAGLSYACAHGDLMRVDAAGIGAPLFELSALRAPNYVGLPEGARADCNARWLDLQAHAATVAQANTAADAGAPDAGAEGDPPQESAAKPGGCTLATGARTVHAWWLSAIWGLVLTARVSRRARKAAH